MADLYKIISHGSHVQLQKENNTHGSSLLYLEDSLKQHFPHTSQKMRGNETGSKFLDSMLVIILSKSVPSQTQTIPNMHSVKLERSLIFSFPCFSISHPCKTHYNITPSHNSCQKAIHVFSQSLKESRQLGFLRSHYTEKFPFPSAWVYSHFQLEALYPRYSVNTSVKDTGEVQGTGLDTSGRRQSLCPWGAYFLVRETHREHLLT